MNAWKIRILCNFSRRMIMNAWKIQILCNFSLHFLSNFYFHIANQWQLLFIHFIDCIICRLHYIPQIHHVSQQAP